MSPLVLITALLTLAGHIIDGVTGSPIAGAKIRQVGGPATTISDSSGRFTLSYIGTAGAPVSCERRSRSGTMAVCWGRP